MIAEESLRRMSIHEDERNANSYNQQHSSRSNSVQPQDLYHDQPPPRNAYARSNVSTTFFYTFFPRFFCMPILRARVLYFQMSTDIV